MTILCLLPISLNVEDTVLFNKQQLVNNKKRLQQYVNGFDKFLNFNKNNILNKIIDVVISDNTFTSSVKLPEDITNIIKKYDLLDYVTIITHNNNKYGKYNKGCGIIEQWIYNKDLIKRYDWFIHFEPRQMLKSNTFIDTFVENKSTMFTFGAGNNHFNTGLFTINTETLFNYIDRVNLIEMIEKQIGIEYSLFEYFVKNKIKTKIVNKMDLVWFAYANDKEYIYEM